MPDTVVVDVAYPNPGDVIAQRTVTQSGGTYTASGMTTPAQVPPGAAFYVGATGTSAAGRTGARVWQQYVAAPTVTPADPSVTFPQALGTLTARPSWVDDFKAMFGVSFNPATTEGDQAPFVPTRTVTLDLTDVGTFTDRPAFNGAWMNYFGNQVGYRGTWQAGDRLIVPQLLLSSSDNLDIPPSVTNVEVVFGTATSACVIRHYQITESTGLMDRHSLRIKGASKIRLRAASRDYPAVFETVGAVGRTGLNQQGNTMLLLDPGTTDVQVQDIVLRGARAAGFFAYRATRYWLNRVRSEETQADAFHNTNGSSYGLFTNCTTKKSGDDGWACVRYNGEAAIQVSNHLAVVRHRVEQTGHGRGFANICCSDIWWDQIYVEGSAAASMIIDREASTQTPAIGIYNFLAQRVHLKGGNWSEQGHGALFMNNGQTNEEVHGRVESLLIEDAPAYMEVIRGVGGSGGVLEFVLKDVKATGGPGNLNNPAVWFGGNNKSRIVFTPDAIRAEVAGADTTPPTIVFLAPGMNGIVAGTTVAGPDKASGSTRVPDLGNTGAYRNTMLAFYCGDNRGGVQSVEVKVGDTVVATVPKTQLDAAGRVALAGIDWSKFANGPGLIRLTATDASGKNTGTHTRGIVLANDKSGTVSPLPGGGAASSDTTPPTAPGTLTVTRASGSATDGTVAYTASTDTGSGVLGYNAYWTPEGGATVRLNPSFASIGGTSYSTTGLSSAAGVIAVEAVDSSPARNVSTRVSITLSAYTAPAVTPTGSRPTTSQTLLLDWDAAGSGAVDSRADTLQDTSGSSRHLTQPDATRRPFVVAGPKSGQKALQFNGAYLRTTASGITGQKRAVVSALMRVDAAAAVDRPALLSGTPGPSLSSDYIDNDGSWNLALPRFHTDSSFATGTIGGSVVASNDSAYSLSPGMPFGQWFLLEVEMGVDGQPARAWVDGVKVADFTGRTNTVLQLGALTLGARTYDNGISDFARISVARVLLHAGARVDSTVAWARSIYGVAGAVQADTTPPTAPGSPKGTRATSGKIDTSWEASSDNVSVDHYEVWGTIAGGDTAKVSPSLASTVYAWEWTDTRDVNGYYFVVRAYDAAGNFSESVGVSVPKYVAPAAPTLRGAATHVRQSATALVDTGPGQGSVSLSSAPIAGRLLVTIFAANKTTGGVAAPAGWTLAGHWKGTAGVGLAMAVKTSTGSDGTVAWDWVADSGGALIIAEMLVDNPSIDGTPVVSGTEDAVTSLTAASPAPAAGVPIRIVAAGVDSISVSGTDPTWSESGPVFTNATSRVFTWGDPAGGSVAADLATQAVTSSAAASVVVQSQSPDQLALIVAKVKGTLVADARAVYGTSAFDQSTYGS